MTRLEEQDEEVYVELIDFGRSVRAREAVTLNDDGSYTIFVNRRLSTDRQRRSVEHALKHINNGDFRKHDVQQIEAEAHGIAPTILKEETYEEKRRKRFEAMRKRNEKARKRNQRQLAKKQNQFEILLETDDKYTREHDIFGI